MNRFIVLLFLVLALSSSVRALNSWDLRRLECEERRQRCDAAEKALVAKTATVEWGYNGRFSCSSGVLQAAICDPNGTCVYFCEAQPKKEEEPRVVFKPAPPQAEGFQSTGWRFLIFLAFISFLLAFLMTSEASIRFEAGQNQPRRAVAVASAWKSAQTMRAYKLLHQE
jgi:hypothetical protein